MQRLLRDSPTHNSRDYNAAGTAFTEWHNQVAGIVYRDLSTEYGLHPPIPTWEIPQKVVENVDFHIHTERQVTKGQSGASGSRALEAVIPKLREWLQQIP